MTTVLIVIHLMVVLAMIAVVLLQRSEGGALGIGGGGGGGGGFMTARGAGNLLTRTTAFLAVAFFATSISLTILARIDSRPSDILDRLPAEAAGEAPTAPADADAPLAPPVSSGEIPGSGAPGGPGVLEALRPQGEGSGPQTPPAQGTGSGQ